MAKKRGRTKRKTKGKKTFKRKKVVKRKKRVKRKKTKKKQHFDKKILTNAILIAVLILALIVFFNKYSGIVLVKNLRLDEGEKNYIHFDMQHTFSTEKECFADIKMYRNNKVLCSKVQNLGLVEPNQEVSKSLLMPFPEGDTDFKVDISCR